MDIEQDSKTLTPDGNAMLSDERAQYYGWIETSAPHRTAHSAPEI